MDSQDTNTTRARLAYAAVAALVLAGVLGFLYGDKLTATQIGLLSVIVTQIAGKANAAYSFYFDGTASKSKPEATTPTTKEDTQ